MGVKLKFTVRTCEVLVHVQLHKINCRLSATTGLHQMWATDASYFRVVGRGYYYLVTVMDDYSRFIPSTSSGQASPGG